LKRFRKGDDELPPGRDRNRDAARELEEAIGRGAPPGWGDPGFQMPGGGPPAWQPEPAYEAPGYAAPAYGAPRPDTPDDEYDDDYQDEYEDEYDDEQDDEQDDGPEAGAGGGYYEAPSGTAPAASGYDYGRREPRPWDAGQGYEYEYPDAKAEEPEVTEFALAQWAQASGASRPEELVLRVDTDEITSARDRALQAFLDRRDSMRAQHARDRSIPDPIPSAPRTPWADVIPQTRPRRPAETTPIRMHDAEVEAAPEAPVAKKRAPAKRGAAKRAPAKRAPAKRGAAKKAPAAKKQAPAGKAPARKAPAKRAAATKAPAPKKAPVKKAPVTKAAVKKAPAAQRSLPPKKAPVKKAPVKKAPVKKAAVKKAVPTSRGGGRSAPR